MIYLLYELVCKTRWVKMGETRNRGLGCNATLPLIQYQELLREVNALYKIWPRTENAVSALSNASLCRDRNTQEKAPSAQRFGPLHFTAYHS